MLSADENPGVFTFMVGMIVLVMAGVGLSLVIDRRLTFSSGTVRMQKEIKLDALELEGLIAVREERARLLPDAESKLETGSETPEAILGRLEALRQRQASLEDARRRQRETITGLEEDFSRYRAEYRRKTWSAALGERLGNLVLGNGREYREATITRVTDVGLEIRHAHGIARIQAPDLDQKTQDRFQWSDEERGKVLKDELDNLDGIPDKIVEDVPAPVVRIPALPVRESSRAPTRPAPDSSEVAALRRLLIGWKSKVSKLRSERAAALSNSSYGNQTSVPGSLETWGARAERLGNELARAQSALAVAKLDLAAVSPGDPLLRPDMTEP